MKARIIAPILGLAAATMFAMSAHSATFVLVDEGKIKGGGLVTELGSPGDQVRIKWTNKNGQEIGKTGIQTIGASGKTVFRAPKVQQGQTVADFKQFVKKGNAGEVSELEVFAFEPDGVDFLVTPFNDYVRMQLGWNQDLRIPDLYADTNGDGGLGEGDVLFSAVNLVDYFAGGLASDYSFGDQFSVVNGAVTQLPGFFFGLDPFVRDPNAFNGLINPHPYSGEATVLSEHLVSAVVPVPAAVWLFGTALIGFIGMSRRTRVS